MRKLKLHMDMSLDGFVAGPQGQQDWWSGTDNDEQLSAFENQFVDSSDTILLGRKTAGEFTRYWESVKSDSSEHPFALRMLETPKVVFSRILHIRGRIRG